MPTEKTPPMGTYQIVKSLPAKGFDWDGFVAALRADQVAHMSGAYCQVQGLAECDELASSGLRGKREAAMRFAMLAVDRKSKRVNIIQPSDESRAWDSFEGGHHDVWTDAEAMAEAVEEFRKLANTFRQ